MSDVKSTSGNTIGRRPGGEDTKSQIVAAAQACFAQEGYDRTSLRKIAVQAGVDPALLLHYFGSKQQLFMAAMLPLFTGPQLLPGALEGDDKTRGLRLATLFITLISEPSVQTLLLGLFKSVSSENEAAALLRSFVHEAVITRIEPFLPGPNRGLQANIIGSQLLGIFIARYIVKIEPIASADTKELIEYLAPRLQAHFEHR
jgi:AcrR family transcriptional regulator